MSVFEKGFKSESDHGDAMENKIVELEKTIEHLKLISEDHSRALDAEYEAIKKL